MWGSPDIVIVDVTDKDVANYGRLPWPRDIHGKALEILNAQGAVGVYFDFVFLETDERWPEKDASAPVMTDEGWLCIYHAKGDNSRYSLFGMLLDLEQPWKAVKRSTMPLFESELGYETTGFYGNVVFTNGIVIQDRQLFTYYGSSDETTCLSVSSVKQIL